MPIIAVASSHSEEDVPSQKRAHEVGELVARLGAHLLTGGGPGLMAEVARAFVGYHGSRKGLSIGIIPSRALGRYEPRDGYPNDSVEVAILTHLLGSIKRSEEPDEGRRSRHSRNSINAATPRVVVGLKGGHGTSDEIRLAQTYSRPVIAYVSSPEDIPDLTEVPIVSRYEDLESELRRRLSSASP